MNRKSKDVLLVLVTIPNRESAEKMAAELVGRRLAACVNIVPGLTSIYRWKDGLQRDREVLLLIKSRRKIFSKLQKLVTELHPYELPEIIALDIAAGSQVYLDWVISESSGEKPLERPD